MWRGAGFSIFCRFFSSKNIFFSAKKKILHPVLRRFLDLIFVIHTNITPTALIDIQIFYKFYI